MSPVDTPQLFDLWMCGEITSGGRDRSNSSMTGGGGLYKPAATDEHIAGISLLLPLLDKQLEYCLSV
jgi:hypothetical protein